MLSVTDGPLFQGGPQCFEEACSDQTYRCRARHVRKALSASDLNGSGLVDSSEDAEGQAEQGGLVGLRGMKASPGRPNISAVLSRVVQEYSTEQEIGVVAAGALHHPHHPC